MLNDKKPSILKTIQVDYPSFLAAIFPPLMWAFYVFDFLRGRVVSDSFLLTLFAITAAAGFVLIWRYASVVSVFNEGIETQATINDIGFFRGRGRVTYVYKFQGQKYFASNMVMKTRLTENLKIGDCVIVMVVRDNPKRALIRDLYI